MRVRSLGHVVLKVRDIKRSEAFYRDTLGIEVVGRISSPVQMTFFTLGHHHDLALMELETPAPMADPRAPGLAHVAFEVSDLDEARADLASAGIAIEDEQDHGFSESVFVRDPDANQVELFVETAS
jgi:catechol 2,3-dioxygenase